MRFIVDTGQEYTTIWRIGEVMGGGEYRKLSDCWNWLIAILINLVMDSGERGCKVYLTGMSDHFRKIFGVVGLTRYTGTAESVEGIAKGQ